MSPPSESPLFRAIQSYRNHAGANLSAESLQKILPLMKELNFLLPQKNLLRATLDDLNEAGQVLRERGYSPGDLGLLRTEIARFYDVAMEEGFISYHPLKKTARIHVSETAPVAAAAPSLLKYNTAWVANLVENLVEETLQKGLLISPLSMSLVDSQERTGFIDSLADSLSGRWSQLAERFSWLLDGLKIAVPILTIILAVNAWFSEDNPVWGMQRQSMEAGNAVQKLELLVNMMESEPMEMMAGETMAPGSRPISVVRNAGSLEVLSERFGIFLGKESEVFTLVKINPYIPMLYVRHNPTGKLVMISPEHRSVVNGGRLKVLK